MHTRVNKSDLQVYPYFWQLTDLCIARYQAKSRDKLVNHSCQLLYNYVRSKLPLFPYFLYMQSIPTSF